MISVVSNASANTASNQDWLKVSENMVISVYSGVLPEQSSESFTKANFEQDLKKVARKIKK